jgi:hypothetical protein
LRAYIQKTEVFMNVRRTFLLTVLFAVTSPAAQISSVDLFRLQLYTQTSNSQPVSPAGYQWAARAFIGAAGDFDSATVTDPNSNPFAMGPLNPTTFQYQSPVVATLGAFNAIFPAGAYTFDLNDSTASNPDSPAQVSTTRPTVDSNPTSIPFLTNFTALAGLDPAIALVLNWNAFTGTTADSFVFLEIFQGGTRVFNAGFLPSASTSVNLPANTLLPNTVYQFRLIFSNRVVGTYDSGEATFAPLFGYDFVTTGDFTTGQIGGSQAIPEPSTLALLPVGLGLLALVRRRR